MNYKKIIPSKKVRIGILKLMEFIPDKLMIKFQYRVKTGRKLNLANPVRYNEKLQWYKLFYRDPLFTLCADKYLVREFVKKKGYEHILIPLFNVYDNANHIDFSELPDEFVLKTNNTSKTNIICNDKTLLDENQTVKQLNDWLLKNSGKSGREWSYYNIEPKIVCEKLIKDDKDPSKPINDYKFLCFNGVVKYTWIDSDRFEDHTRDFYDADWNYINVSSDIKNSGVAVEKPSNFEEMKKIAAKLSEDFPHVRVDLYNVNGKVYFGELTFYSLSGYETFDPDEFDFTLGEEFVLPEKKV